MAEMKSSRSKPIINNNNDNNNNNSNSNSAWLTFLTAVYYQFSRINSPDNDQSMTVWDAQWSAFFYGRSLAYSMHYYGREIYDDIHPEYGRSYETLDTPLSTDMNKMELILTIMNIVAFGYIRMKLGGDGGVVIIAASIITPYIKPTLRHIRLRHVWCNPNVTPLSSESILTAEKDSTKKIKRIGKQYDENGIVLPEEAVEEDKKKENIFIPGKDGYIKFRNRLKDEKYWKLTSLSFHQIERFCVY